MIICYFGFCVGYNRQQSAFADVRISDKSYVRYRHQFHYYGMLFGRLPFLRIMRSLSTRSFKSCVAFAAQTSRQNNCRLTVVKHVCHYFSAFFVSYYSTSRHVNNKVFALFTVAILWRTVLSVRRFKMLRIPVISKRAFSIVYSKFDIAALSPVATVRASVSNILFGIEGSAAVAAFACLNINLDFVYKHLLFFLIKIT